MKKMNKLMAIGLSLVMCAGMVAPAFAADAYFYGKIEGTNDWVVLGTGEISDEIAAPTGNPGPHDSQSIAGVVTDGKLSTATDGKDQPMVTAPEEFNDVTRTNTDGTTTTYQYDDGKDETEVGQYSYDVTWTEAKWASGANGNPGEGALAPLGTWTPHVDATIELHENTGVQVVIKDFNGTTNEAGEAQFTAKEDSDPQTKYVRDTTPEDQKDAAINSVAESIAKAIDNDIDLSKYTVNETEGDNGEIVKTYTEKTFNVTYTITGAGQDSSTTTTHGKVNSTFTAQENKGTVPGVGGYYTFTNWVAGEPDADGNVIYTATCTFTPYPTYDYGDTDVTIDDQAVPLAAGPVTRAEFIDYLWRHEGEPDSEGVCTFTDVEDTHEYFDALCWAEENGVAEAYLDAEGHEDGAFEPDELVTVEAVREFLGNFETVFGTNAVAAAELTTLTGEDGEAVLNCDQVLAEFFGEEYELPEDLDALEPDIAA